jgi:hypothetical protein
MAKLSTSKEVTREKKQQKSFANVLQATGLGQLKPIQPVRSPAVKPKAKAKSKTPGKARK